MVGENFYQAVPQESQVVIPTADSLEHPDGRPYQPRVPDVQLIANKEAARAIAKVEDTQGQSAARALEAQMAQTPELADFETANQRENFLLMRGLVEAHPQAFRRVKDTKGREAYLTSRLPSDLVDINQVKGQEANFKARYLLSPYGLLELVDSAGRVGDEYDARMSGLDNGDFTPALDEISEPGIHRIMRDEELRIPAHVRGTSLTEIHLKANDFERSQFIKYPEFADSFKKLIKAAEEAAPKLAEAEAARDLLRKAPAAHILELLK